MAFIVTVDHEDNPIGAVDRSLINDYITRVASLWIFNPYGEMLIAKRAKTKQHNPDQWGPAVAGTVEEGETYESNIVKEAFEEVGLTITTGDLIIGDKSYRDEGHRYFSQRFFAIVDKALSDFMVQEIEVSELRFVGLTQLKTWATVRPHEFVPRFADAVPAAVPQSPIRG